MTEKSFLFCESEEECVNWWAHDFNNEELFRTIRKRSRQKVYWRCPQCNLVFDEYVYRMVLPNIPKCPSCLAEKYSKKMEKRAQLEHMPVSSVPELMEAWADERDPSKVMVIPHSATGNYGDSVFRFRCPKGHYPRMSPDKYLKRGCQICRAERTINSGEKCIRREFPELAAEWDNSLNGKYTPDNIRHNSVRLIWWQCMACGNRWEESPRNRTQSYEAHCPSCGKVLGSLAWKYPEIAKEWDPHNELSAWQVRRRTHFIPKWICGNNPNHRWETRIENRINGSLCPYCVNSRHSRIESYYYDAAKNIFDTVELGAQLTENVFSHAWEVDILATLSERKIVIEYDGLYWHQHKIDHDIKKTNELLEAGYLVFRLRELGLPSLKIRHHSYFEMQINPLSPKYETTMKRIMMIGE